MALTKETQNHSLDTTGTLDAPVVSKSPFFNHYTANSYPKHNNVFDKETSPQLTKTLDDIRTNYIKKLQKLKESVGTKELRNLYGALRNDLSSAGIIRSTQTDQLTTFFAKFLEDLLSRDIFIHWDRTKATEFTLFFQDDINLLNENSRLGEITAHLYQSDRVAPRQTQSFVKNLSKRLESKGYAEPDIERYVRYTLQQPESNPPKEPNSNIVQEQSWGNSRFFPTPVEKTETTERTPERETTIAPR